MEEKDGGEKVRLGMVVSYLSYSFERFKRVEADFIAGHSRKLRRHARGSGKNRRRQRRQRMRHTTIHTLCSAVEVWRGQKLLHGFMAFAGSSIRYGKYHLDRKSTRLNSSH